MGRKVEKVQSPPAWTLSGGTLGSSEEHSDGKCAQLSHGKGGSGGEGTRSEFYTWCTAAGEDSEPGLWSVQTVLYPLKVTCFVSLNPKTRI